MISAWLAQGVSPRCSLADANWIESMNSLMASRVLGLGFKALAKAAVLVSQQLAMISLPRLHRSCRMTTACSRCPPTSASACCRT